ncbi:hypothetical protein [Halorubrum aethiopicum]|uniref:hypothetical protein n=1 Tax=Halorubrum aethiopicum TaxID=1758255 RepID=UPI000A96E900|nr:hypothetical protein [Halorubrum aethiopicum]
MATVFGAIGAQTFVVLVIAAIGVVPVVLYRRETPTVFLVPYAFLVVAAFATNVENLVAPDLLNLAEHYVGNLGAGVSFAAAAYLYRRRTIVADGDDAAGAAETVLDAEGAAAPLNPDAEEA